MKGDFSRGHRPDGKRGTKYRRILAQQNRLVLDSDIDALVDALTETDRDLSRQLGCPAGSPDLGFLVTGGPLLALFRDLDAVTESGPPFEAHRDYSKKFLERYPSLYLNAGPGAGSVTIQGRRLLALADFPKIRIWGRIAAGQSVGVKIDGQAATDIAGVDDTVFKPYDVTVPVAAATNEYQEIELSLTGGEAWIGLIEGFEEAEKKPRFWVAAGHYHLDGLIAQLGEDCDYPDVTYPPEVGFALPDLGPAIGPLFLAYLEAYERHITCVEDPGIQERALGGTLDTTTRTRVMGQVKILATSLTVAEIEERFVPEPSTARIEINIQKANPAADPCAIPEATGYSGDENRLYRVEVHQGGAIGTAVFKWSRDNGSDLFPVLSVTPDRKRLGLPVSVDVRDGDLLEYLVEPLELGDANPAAFTGTGFVPPERLAGPLFRVKVLESPGTAQETVVELLDLNHNSTTLDTALVLTDKAIRKVRRWHGRIDTQGMAAGVTVPLEDGLEVTLVAGPMRAGEHWQFEARKGEEHVNLNGDFQTSPHGPERDFAPLALLEFKGENQPMEVLHWFDDRFRALCHLTADDIAYDGEGAGSDADTVQEAIDEIYERVEGGCCDANLEPGRPGEDDGQRINDAIQNDLPAGGVLCLRRGVYRVTTPILIERKRIELKGCPGAILVHESVDGCVRVGEGGHAELTDLLLLGRGPDPGVIQVRLEHVSAEVRAQRTGFVQGSDDAIAIGRVGTQPITPSIVGREHYSQDPEAESFGDEAAPVVTLEDSVVVATWGVLADRLSGLSVEDCVLFCRRGAVNAGAVATAHLESSLFDATLVPGDLAGLQNAAVEDAEAAVRELLDNVPGTRANGGIAFYASFLFGGRSLECAYGGSIGLWLGLCRSARLQGNRYLTQDTGLRLDNAIDMACREEDVVTRHIGVHVVYTGVETEIAGCRIAGPRPLVLAADLKDGLPAPSRMLRNVLVGTNRLEAEHLAVQVGRVDGDAEAGLFYGLEIHDNLIQGGVGVDGVSVHVPTTFRFQLPRLRIAGNQIQTGRTAVRARGSNVEIESNRFAKLDWADREHPLVLLHESFGALVEDNHFELPLPIIIVDPVPGLAVTGTHDLQPLAEIANIMAPAVGPVGLRLVGGGNARVAGNVFVGMPGSRTLLVDGRHSFLHVEGNDFGATGWCFAGALEFPTFRSNRFGLLRLIGAKEGTITENGGGDIEVTQAVGAWQVGGNRAARIILLPPVRPIWLDDVLDDFRDLEVERAMVEESPMRVRPELGANVALPMMAMRHRGGEAARIANEALAQPERRAPDPVVEEIWIRVDRELGELVGIFDDLVVRPPLLFRRENAFRALVVGNHAALLHVGHRNPQDDGPSDYPAYLPSPISVVQVVANQGDTIVVNRYAKSVVAHNVAKTPVGLATSAGPLNEKNLDI